MGGLEYQAYVTELESSFPAALGRKHAQTAIRLKKSRQSWNSRPAHGRAGRSFNGKTADVLPHVYTSGGSAVAVLGITIRRR